MSITSSVIVEDRAQVDGRRSVTERHTDHLSRVHVVQYVAESGANIATALASRVAILEARLAANELEENVRSIVRLGAAAVVTIEFATLAQVRVRLRTFYQVESGEKIARMASYLLTRTDAELRAIFNVVQGQVAALRSRLQSKVDCLTSLVGE